MSAEDPTFLQRVAEESRGRAYEDLGILKQEEELEQIEKQKEKLERRESRLKAEQFAIIKGTTVEEELTGSTYHYGNVVENAVEERAEVLGDDILSESELGKQILSLRNEKENLLDTVWLATSSAQIKELWGQVNALLEIKPSELEEKALKMAPVDEE